MNFCKEKKSFFCLIFVSITSLNCCLVFCPRAGSLCLVYSRRESYLQNTNKARAHLYGGAPDSFQTENSYIVGIKTGISRTEVRILTTELRRLSGLNKIIKLFNLPIFTIIMRVFFYLNIFYEPICYE